MAPALDATQSSRPVAELLQQIDQPGPLPLATFALNRNTAFGLAFYLNRRVAPYEGLEISPAVYELPAAIPASAHILVTRENSLPALRLLLARPHASASSAPTGLSASKSTRSRPLPDRASTIEGAFSSSPRCRASHLRSLFTSVTLGGRIPAVGTSLVVEILDLRHFASADLRSLVEEEVAVWRKTLHWDYRSSADMVLRYADSRILPGFAAIERGRVHGYCFFVYEGAKGVIGDLYVEDSASTHERRHAIEIELLRHSISTLQQSPGLHRVEAQLLIHPTGHLAAPFLDEGFRRFRRLFLALPIDFSYSRAPAPASA